MSTKKSVRKNVKRSAPAAKVILKKSANSEFEKINASFSENALKMMKKRYLQNKADGTQETPAEMFARVAKALAEVDKRYGKSKNFMEKTEREFFEIMSRKEYTPAGRTVTNAGSSTALVANCIVLPIPDSMEGIFQTLKDSALLQQKGSGLGFEFSSLRPAFSKTTRSQGVSSGPVSFLKVYNEAFGMIKQQGRHGANMAQMSVSHPDILDFIRAKEVEGEIRNFNISIHLTDEFMKQLIEKPDAQWYGEWNGEKRKPQRVIRAKNGAVTGVEEMDISVKEIFDEIVNYAWHNGEPGVVFIDEVNRTNPLPGLGPIKTSNPCGEQFLHPYDNCNLGSINLAEFVKNGKVDWAHLRHTTRAAVRLMDNVIDLFDFPVPQVTEFAQKNRRIGLGIMGFADMLYQLEVGYNTAEGRKIGEKVMQFVNDAAHGMSEQLAKEKGVFPNIKLSIYAKGKNKAKMRNAALTTVAPTGSISMMFDCSSGLEPNFAIGYVKQDKDGTQYQYFNQYFESALKAHRIPKKKVEEIKDAILKTGSIQSVEGISEILKKTFVAAMDISADDHLGMQAAFQRHVDNSISKTINFPNSATKEEVANGFIKAWQLKCKAATVYRDGSRTVQILNLGTGEGLVAPSEIGTNGIVKKVETPPLYLPMDEGRTKVRTRPETMNGRTYQVKTGYGNLYVTINNDENGVPFELFATIGKAGGFYQEQSDAIGRMVSLALRGGIKVEEIINQLKGIRGPMPMMTSKGTVLSLPDAIARILEEHVTTNGHITTNISGELSEPLAQEMSLPAEKPVATYATSKKAIADFGMMPGCPDCGGALTMAEGCMSCKSCGFSRCT